MNFGETLKKIRIAKGLTLHEFCVNADIDACLVSKLERSVAAPPEDRETLEKLARALGLEPSSSQYQELMEIAHAYQGYKKQPLSDEEALQKMPIFLRDQQGNLLDDEKAKKLLELVKEA